MNIYPLFYSILCNCLLLICIYKFCRNAGHTMSEFRSAVEGRHGSLEDLNLDQVAKATNYEDTVKQLDNYYGIGTNYCLSNMH